MTDPLYILPPFGPLRTSLEGTISDSTSTLVMSPVLTSEETVSSPPTSLGAQKTAFASGLPEPAGSRNSLRERSD